MCWLVLVCWLGVEQARTWSQFTEWCLGDTEVERKYRLFFQEIRLWNTWYLSYGIQHAVLNICLHLTSKPVGQSWYPSVSLFSEAQTQNLACNQHIIKMCSILLNNSITNPLFPVSLFLWFHCGYGQRVTLFLKLPSQASLTLLFPGSLSTVLNISVMLSFISLGVYIFLDFALRSLFFSL